MTSQKVHRAERPTWWITGSSGQIGTALIEFLSAKDCNLVEFHRGTALAPRGKSMTWEMGKQELPTKGLEAPDVVIHLAAQTSAHVARLDPAADAQTNIVGFLHLLQSVVYKVKKPVVILVGSTSELEPGDEGKINETCRDNPLSLYEISKSTCRNFLREYSRAGLVQGRSLLLSNVYGGRISSVNDRGFMNRCFRNALEAEDIFFYEGGDFYRDYIHVSDVVGAIWAVATHDDLENFETFVVGSGISIRIQDALRILAQTVSKSFGHDVQVTGVMPPHDLLETEKRNDWLDLSKISGNVGWYPKIKFVDGIQLMIDEVNSTNGQRSRNS